MMVVAVMTALIDADDVDDFDCEGDAMPNKLVAITMTVLMRRCRR